MATNQEAQTLEETLNKTDLGHVINENKKPIMAAGAVIIAAIIGYSIFSQVNSSKKLEKLDKIFALEQSLFQNFADKKTTAADFKTQLAAINNELISEPNLIPVFMDSINRLDQAGEADESVLGVAKNWLSKLNKNSPMYVFLGLRVAALSEDLGKSEDAIATLEGLVGHKTNILKDKIHFDLIRLYVKKGDMKKANERYETLKTKHEKSEFVKLGNIFLNGLQ
jgi:predicted negative regulator of RcsB-dependent stress response